MVSNNIYNLMDFTNLETVNQREKVALYLENTLLAAANHNIEIQLMQREIFTTSIEKLLVIDLKPLSRLLPL